MRLDRLAWMTQGFVVCCLMASAPVQAQIVPDGTLGAERSRVTPINPNTERIDGGAIRGSNLFHSFQEFSIGEGRGAYFANPVGVDNILSRVTGRNPSNILGTLGVLGNANLYLLNPNGIFFGPNARLDIRGSFTASTADSIVFSDRALYSATDTQTRPLLTVAVPIGLQYGVQQAGAISNAGNLAVGQDLSLIAGNLDLQGQLQAGSNLTLRANNTVQIRDSISRPFIAQAGEDLMVQGDQKIDIFALNHSASGFFSNKNIVLRSASTVRGDSRYISGGDFRIEKLDGILGSLYSPYDPIIRASGNISFDSYEGASLHVFAGGSVNIPGTITITESDQFNSVTENVILSDGRTILIINGSTQPTLDVRAGTTAFGNPLGLTGAPSPTNLTIGSTSSNANINIGSINVVPANGLVFITNQYLPNNLLSGGIISTTGSIEAVQGQAVIDARNGIQLGTDASAQSIDVSTATGNGGNIQLLNNVGSIIVNGQLRTSTGSSGGDGKAGDVFIRNNAGSIDVYDTIEQNGVSDSNSSAGNLTINASGGDINVRNIQAGVVNRISNTLGFGGDGGKINLTATGNITTNGEIHTFVRSRLSSVGGDIALKSSSGSIIIRAGSINSSSNINNGGKIEFIAAGNIVLDDILSYSGGRGNGGDITLKSSNGAITIPGVIDASSHLAFLGNVGNGGNINLEARGDITTGSIESIGQRGGQIILNSGNNLSVTKNDIVSITTGQGRGGDINLLARSVTLTDARVANLTFGDGRAGDILVKGSDSINILNQGGFSPTDIGSPLFQILKQEAERFEFNGAGIVSTTGSIFGGRTIGNTGDITVETGQLLIQANPGISKKNLTGISTATLAGSGGSSGIIKVTAPGSITIIGNNFDQFIPKVFSPETATETATQIRAIRTGITSATQGSGNAGAITVTTGQLSIRQGAAITTGITESGTGNGGDLTINARSIDLQGQAALATATLAALETRGKAGDLTINADRLTLQDGALISADKVGKGFAGSVTINAGELLMTNRSRIGSSALGSGKGGDLTLTIARSIQMKNIGDPQNATEIASNAFDDANGGNITILVGGQIRAKKGENNDIVATTERGQGGLVDVQAGGLIDFFIKPKGARTFENELSANSSGGLNGVVNRNGDATQQPPPTQPTVRDLPQVCPQGVTTRQAGRSDFMNTGRGGLPPNPGEALESNTAQVPWVTLEPEPSISADTTTSQPSTTSAPESIEEAQGWMRFPNGRVFLTTKAPAALPNPCPLSSSPP